MARSISIVEKLNPASFRGVPFLVPDETVTRGQKVAVHEYPNSDKRFAEPLGKIPSDIDLTGIVHGEFYFEERKDLERALEVAGQGELIHPIYGSIQAQPGKFTVTSNQRKVGEFIFTMKFYVSEDISPNPLPATKQTVDYAAGLAFGSMLDAVEALYEDPSDSNSLLGAVDTVLGALDAVNDAIDSVVDPIEAAFAATNTAIAQFRNGVYNIMQTGAGLKNSLLNVYNNFVQLSLDAATLTAAWDNLINFDQPETPAPTTVQRTNRANNQNVAGSQANIGGLIGGLQAAANTDFNTTDDLQERSAFLDDTFNSLFEQESDSPLVTDPNLRASMANLRVVAKESLDNQKSKIWKQIEINPGKTSMSLTSYRYYGNLDQIANLIELNPDKSASNFNEVITAVVK